MEIKHYIKLLVPEKIDNSKIRTFFDVVSNVAKDILEPHDDGKYITLEKNDDGFSYCVYLTTDLNKEQINEIKLSLLMFPSAKLKISQDKSVHVDFNKHEENNINSIKQQVTKIEPDHTPYIGEEFAKYNHNKWMQNKLDKGWQYGVELDMENKKHPLLVPWERLPEQHREIDPNFGQFFTKILDSINHKISPK